MFKSVFAKYVTTFMALLLVSFLLLLFIVNSVVSNDSFRAEQSYMQSASDSCSRNLSELYAIRRDISFSEFVRQGTAGDTAYISRVLGSALASNEDMTVYVTDQSGGFLFSTGKNAAAAPAVGTPMLPEDYFSALAEANAEIAQSAEAARVPALRATAETAKDGLPGVYLKAEDFGTPAETLVYARPICDEEGHMPGHLIITSTAESRTHLMETTLRSVAVAGLWIMLAALIAIYFTTERIIGPLREMSRASKKLMVGQYDVRVHVHGNDEVAELAGAFNQLAGALENLEQMRNSFVANVSHDLRTPMTTISGFIDGILDGVIPKEEQAHYLRVVSDEVRRLSRLVTALLDVSRLQAGDRKFDMKPFDICETGRQILISFEQKIDERHLDVSFDCDEERMYVLADRDAIHQILYNICDNAVKFSYDGGRLRMGFAWGEGSHGAQKVVVTVYNEGPGIPDEDIPFVFERFYKSDKSRSLDKTGVGLGMFIAKTIINAHNETISVSGEFGRYCEFTFTLPRTEPPANRGRNPGTTIGGNP